MALQSLGPRIRKARQEAGLSGVALAKLIDKSQPYISDLERGQRTPSLETLCSLAAALGRPLSYFLGENDDDKAPSPRKRPVLAASPATEVRSALASLVAEQLQKLPFMEGDDAPTYEQLVRIVDQAIDNGYHELHRTLREQRRRASVR